MEVVWLAPPEPVAALEKRGQLPQLVPAQVVLMTMRALPVPRGLSTPANPANAVVKISRMRGQHAYRRPQRDIHRWTPYP